MIDYLILTCLALVGMFAIFYNQKEKKDSNNDNWDFHG